MNLLDLGLFSRVEENMVNIWDIVDPEDSSPSIKRSKDDLFEQLLAFFSRGDWGQDRKAADEKIIPLRLWLSFLPLASKIGRGKELYEKGLLNVRLSVLTKSMNQAPTKVCEMAWRSKYSFVGETCSPSFFEGILNFTLFIHPSGRLHQAYLVQMKDRIGHFSKEI